jgi:hypothetical protein
VGGRGTVRAVSGIADGGVASSIRAEGSVTDGSVARVGKG